LIHRSPVISCHSKEQKYFRVGKPAIVGTLNLN
jgi:hypothetical protein